MLRQSYRKSKRNIVFPFSRRSLLRCLKRVVITVRKPVHHKVKHELTTKEKVEQLQWALTHENSTLATWAHGSWSSAVVLQMCYHCDAFKWKEININMWGYAFWNQLGPLVLDRELDCPAPDLQNLVRPEQAKLIVCMPSYEWDINPVNDLWFILARKFERCLFDGAYGLSTSNKAIGFYRQIVYELWVELSSRFDHLLRTMPGRIQALIQANGGYIDSNAGNRFSMYAEWS